MDLQRQACCIGPGMPEIPDNPMFNMKPNSQIYGARCDRMMDAFGGKGFFVEDPKNLKGALEEAMNLKGPVAIREIASIKAHFARILRVVMTVHSRCHSSCA
jgi:thiamine pyrophosphate-dependent acetolactate synthase large subunit-like protein